MTRRRWLLALGVVLVAAAVGAAIGLLVWDRSDPAPEASSFTPEGQEEILQRERWFYEQRTTVGGRVPAEAFLKGRRSASRARGAAGAEALRWTELGPAAIGVGGPEPNEDLDWPPGGTTPYSGRVTSIANHPTQAATAYIGTSGGGVWRTTDDGRTWTPLFDRQPSLSIGAVAVDPNAPDTVYAGTGEANLGVPSYFGAGVFKSTNGGSDWTKIGGSSFDECHVSGIGVKAGVVLVAAHGYGGNRWEFWPDRCKDRQGVWLSEGGDSFRRVLAEGTPADLASSPRDPAVWYAAFWGGRIFKSTDSGRTWRRLELRTTTPTGTVDTVTDGYRIDIDVARSANGEADVVYAVVATGGSQLRGVFRSQDGGDTWDKLNPTVVPSGAELNFADACDRQCNYNLVIAADPKDPSRAYFGGTFFNRYDGNAASVILWGDVHLDYHALSFDASGRLWIGNDGGIWRSDDGGRTVENLNAGIGTALIYPGISGRASGPLYVGMQDNGTARYAGSRSWPLVNWGDGFFAASAPGRPFPTFVTSQFLTITKINETGRCSDPFFEHRGIAGAGTASAPFNAPLVMHPRDPSVMYAGTSQVWRTTNANASECGATRWASASQPFGSSVTTIGPAPSDSNVVYAATAPTNARPAGLYVTRPGGDPAAAWIDTQPNGLPVARHFTDIAVHPTDPGTAWVTVSGFTDGAHIYGTTNYGQTWTDLDNGLPNAPANAVVVDTRGARPVLYVGTDVGVYASDSGASWTNVGGNLPNAAVMDLLLDTSSSPPTLVAATFGRGAWSAPLS